MLQQVRAGSKIMGRRRSSDGEGFSLRTQCADVKKVLGSFREMNLGGNVVALDAGRNYVQNKETGQRARILRGGAVRCVPVVAVEGRRRRRRRRRY